MKNTSHDDFVFRHIGPSKSDTIKMLSAIGVKSLDELIDETIPSDIAFDKKLNIPEADSEYSTEHGPARVTAWPCWHLS